MDFHVLLYVYCVLLNYFCCSHCLIFNKWQSLQIGSCIILVLICFWQLLYLLTASSFSTTNTVSQANLSNPRPESIFLQETLIFLLGSSIQKLFSGHRICLLLSNYCFWAFTEGKSRKYHFSSFSKIRIDISYSSQHCKIFTVTFCFHLLFFYNENLVKIVTMLSVF